MKRAVRDDKAKVIGPHMLSGSQWGLMCPDGMNVGLLKNLALTAHITDGGAVRIFANDAGRKRFRRDAGCVAIQAVGPENVPGGYLLIEQAQRTTPPVAAPSMFGHGDGERLPIRAYLDDPGERLEVVARGGRVATRSTMPEHPMGLLLYHDVAAAVRQRMEPGRGLRL